MSNCVLGSPFSCVLINWFPLLQVCRLSWHAMYNNGSNIHAPQLKSQSTREHAEQPVTRSRRRENASSSGLSSDLHSTSSSSRRTRIRSRIRSSTLRRRRSQCITTEVRASTSYCTTSARCRPRCPPAVVIWSAKAPAGARCVAAGRVAAACSAAAWTRWVVRPSYCNSESCCWSFCSPRMEILLKRRAMLVSVPYEISKSLEGVESRGRWVFAKVPKSI